MLDVPNNREGPQAREPSKCLNGQSYTERLAKEAFWLSATRDLKKGFDRPVTAAAEAVSVPAHLVPPGSPQPKQLCHFHAQSSMGQSCHRQKVFCLCTWGHFGHVQLFETLWTVACQASLSEEFSRQEYWSVLANTGCHTLLDHYISCCPSCQLPWVPGAAKTPATQAAAPLQLILTGADPSLPGEPQEQTYMDSWHAEMEIKPQLIPRGSVAKEENPKFSHQLYKLQIKSTWSGRQTLCLWTI